MSCNLLCSSANAGKEVQFLVLQLNFRQCLVWLVSEGEDSHFFKIEID